MSVILPEEAVHSRELEAQLERLGRLRERGADLKAFDDALKQIDHRLSLVKASENATMPGLTPGYWHIRRENDAPAPDSYLILTAPNGGFVEPHSGLLTWLQGCDLQRRGALEDLQRQQFEQERQRQKAQEALRDERHTEFAERYYNKANASVSLTGVGEGWKYKAHARTG